MRIERIELENFRNHASTDLTFNEDRLLLIGENGQGKSSIIDAISWALTGRCWGVKDNGEGQKDLIRQGAESMAVTIHLKGIGPIQRKLSVSGGSAVSMKNERIMGELKTTTGMLQAVLYGHTFFNLHHGDAKALLMSALNVQIGKKDLPGVKLPKGVDTVDLDFLDQLFKEAFDNRTVVKRERAAHRMPAKPVANIALAGMDLADIKRKLADHQDTLQALVADATTAKQALAQCVHDIDTQAQLVAAVKELGGALGVHRSSLAEHQAHLTTAKQALADAKEQPAEPVDSLTIQARETEVLIDKVSRHDPDRGCVLAASIPCLTKAAEFAGQVDALRTTVKDLAKRIKAGQKRAGDIAAAEQSVKNEDRNVAYHTGQIAAVQAKLDAADAAGTTLTALKASSPGLQQAAQAAGQAVIDQRGVVDTHMTLIQQLQAQQAAQEAYRAAQDRQDVLDDQVTKAEALVALLGPKGVRARALTDAMGQFHEAINQALRPFGFEVSIQVDPWEVHVTTDKGTIRFDMLSKGQRLWTGLGFQLALATVSGLQFCVVDDAEAVVGARRGMLTQTVMLSNLGQIIVSMAKADNEPLPELAGLQVLRVIDQAAA